ncbi:MAG: autotransporter-associated beta strand repeat-containing protein [Thermaurantimonas sp.]
MKKIFTLTLLLCLGLLSLEGWTQTNPTAQSLPYSQDFASFTGSSTTYPAGFQGWTISGSLSASYPTTAPNGDQILAGGTNATNSAGVYDMNGKIGLLSTGSNMRSICLAINTTGFTSINVQYTAATQRTNNTRTNELGLQYRVGTSGGFTNISGSEYVSQLTPTNTSGTGSVKVETISVTLPAACENQSVVQLRWVIRDISGSGERPSFSVDNISITGSSATPTITLHDNSQVTAGNVDQGAVNHIISRFRVNVATADATLNQITFNAGGSFVAGDVLNFKLFTDNTNTFPGGTPLSTVSAIGLANGDAVTFGSLGQTCAIGDHYFWITADVAGPATTGNTVSVPSLSASNFTFAAGTPTGTITAGGAQTIVSCGTSTANVTGLSLSPGNLTMTVSWTNPTCYDEVMIVAKESSAVTGTPTGDGSGYTANLAFGSGTAFGGGYVVYKGFSSPQTITGLTNGTTYYVKIFSRKGTDWSSGIEDFGTYEGYFWNGGDITANPANGGTGIWNTANAWRQPIASGSQATWADNNDAILAGTAGVVTLTGNVTVTGLFANTTGYTITSDNTTGRTITGPIEIADGVELRFNDITTTGNRTISVAGDITGGTGSSISMNLNQTGSNTSRLNIAASGASIQVPITITTGTTSSNYGNVCIAGTAPNTQLTSAATITNNSPYRTTIGATSGNSLTVNSVISGSADLMFAAGSSGGAGTITLNTVHTYTGNTIFNAANSGVIRLGIDNALPTTTEVTMANSSGNGGIFDLNGYNQTIAALSNGAGGGSIRNNGATASTLTINGSTSTTFGLPIENGTGGGLALTKSGTSTLELTGANTYAGLTTINGGTLQLNRNGGTTIPATNNVTINSGGTLRISTNQTLNDLTINTGGQVVVDPDIALTVNGTLTNNGTITLEATTKDIYARLIYGAVSGTGTVEHEMRLVPGTSYKWYAIGSPVDGININSIGTGQFTSTSVYNWGATTGWTSAHTGTFTRGQGIFIAAGENSPHGFFTIPADNTNITFTGSLSANTSAVVRAMDYGAAPTGVNFTASPSATQGWNLLANPYHADFDLDGLDTDNESSEKSLSMRTPTGYESYNPSTNTPSTARYLSPGEAFFVRATNTGQNFTFALSRRTASGGNGLLKPQVNFDRVSVRVSRSDRSDEMYVLFKSDATTGFDGMYDAHKLNRVNGYPMLYSVIGNDYYSINTLPELTGSYALTTHFTCTEAGTYTISLFDVSDFDPSITVTLEDKLTNSFTVLNQGDYTFVHNPSNTANRFVLHFNRSAVGTEDLAADHFNAWVYNGTLYINAFENLGHTHLAISDMSGRIVFETTSSLQAGLRQDFLLPRLASGVYILRVGTAASQKAIKFIVQ